MGMDVNDAGTKLLVGNSVNAVEFDIGNNGYLTGSCKAAHTSFRTYASGTGTHRNVTDVKYGTGGSEVFTLSFNHSRVMKFSSLVTIPDDYYTCFNVNTSSTSNWVKSYGSYNYGNIDRIVLIFFEFSITSYGI